MGKSKGYGQFCPLAKAAEVVAERWTPLVLRELLGGATRFSEIHRGVPLMSPSLLSTRLRELVDAGLVEKTAGAGRSGAAYHLTPAGEELRPVLIALGLWGQKWVQPRIDPGDLDAGLLMWDMRRFGDTTAWPPDRRTLIQFDLDGVPTRKSRWWILIEDESVDVCLKPPGGEVDLYVAAHLQDLTNAWMGRTPLASALRAQAIRLDGPRTNQRAFRAWFSTNLFAQLAANR